MCISTPTFSPFTTKQFDTYLLESPNITGPFRYISYLRETRLPGFHFDCSFQTGVDSP